MIVGKRVCVVMPAYNAGRTLAQTVAEIDRGVVDDIIVVDDASRDDTVEVARRLGLDAIVHPRNRGYGGNQKTCYAAALAHGADIVVMVHPDYQYSPLLIPAMASMVASGHFDCVLGSRILGVGARKGGMPLWKYLANIALTRIEDAVFGLQLTEYHSGFRAYSRRLLETIPYHRNSDDFVFDQELVAQVVAAGGFRIGEIAVPTRYFDEASSVGFRRSVVYGLSTLRVVARFVLHRIGVRRSRKLTMRGPGRGPRS